MDLLEHAIGELAGDELYVGGLVVERLRLGRSQYGQLDASADGRDLEREALEEAADGFVYVGTKLVQARRRHRRVS